MKQHNSYGDAWAGLSAGQLMALGAGVAGFAFLANHRSVRRISRRDSLSYAVAEVLNYYPGDGIEL